MVRIGSSEKVREALSSAFSLDAKVDEYFKCSNGIVLS